MQQFLDVGPSDVVKIFVDTREDPSFDAIFGSFGAYIIRKQLPVGDFICSDRVVVERKTRADFEASIIDGRLFSQLQNLVENYERVVIIVEGTEEMERIHKNAIMGAYCSIIVQYGATLFFTRSIEKTIELVYQLARYEQFSEKRPIRLFAKKKGATLQENQQAILEAFPMVGPKLAKSLLLHFGSLERVFFASERDLLEVEKMGEKKAHIIKKVLSSSFEE